MGNPKVSVIFPVHNAGKFIREAVRSILDQTYGDFELLIIDDGSADDSVKKIIQFEDPRIRLLHNEKNEGLIFTLNRGIAEAKGEFIARMDADDISSPDRFEKQVHYLNKHPNVGVCGTLMRMIHNDKIYKHRFLESDLIKSAFVFTNPLVHPSVMMRKKLFKKGEPVYNKEFLHGEDYALWLSLLAKTGFHIIGTPLIEYRAHSEQVSRKFNSIQRTAVKKAQEMIFSYLGIHPDEEEKEIHLSLFLELYRENESYLSAVEKWLQKLSAAN
ncbi:MAG TPA: glycosyltransferase family 2 protein, partial [Bacteroidia bacterium]|nr:glycosyltransferase family 2 protein [Bacteroidia bacterium]